MIIYDIIKVCVAILVTCTFSLFIFSMGFIIKRAESPRFGYQNLYNVHVFKACYPQFDYSFLNKP